MPKTLMLSNCVLLLCLSVLAGSGLGSGLRGQTVMTMTPADARSWAITATVLAAVMVGTEVLSGLRWLAVAALVAAVIGLILLWGRPTVPLGSVWAWAAGWCAVAGWFAVMANRARQNQ